MSKLRKHLCIPDTQVKPGVPTDHLEALGNYIVEKQPDVIIHVGDHWDVPSLSSYDEDLAGFDRRDYQADIDAGNEAFKLITAPTEKYNKRRKTKYEPRKIFLRGNHENRIIRFTDLAKNARFKNVVSPKDCDTSGWQDVPFLKPITVDGIVYCHYFTAKGTGRAIGGNAHYKLTKLKFSYVMGHVQDKDSAQEYLCNGRVIRGLMAGTFYQHKENYLGHQGNFHWHGVHILHECNKGNYNHMEVSLGYLLREYL